MAPEQAGATRMGTAGTQVLLRPPLRIPVTLAAVRARLLTPAGGATAATLLFLAISAWWVHVDRAVPNGDPARHLLFAFADLGYLNHGQVGAALGDSTSQYPPLVHLVGAVTMYLTSVGIGKAVLALNLIFVPLLALGCYGAGKAVTDERGGLYAVLFALGAPMVISQFHQFMIDTPLTAMVAVTVWLLLASDRFRRRRYVIAAGVAGGFGMLTKETFAFFLIGIVVVMLIRGGWRNWANVLICGAIALAISVPWYATNWAQLHHTAQIANDMAHGNDPVRPFGVYSLTNFGWYGWAMTFLQLLVPLTAFFAVGLGVAAFRRIRRLPGMRYTVELFVGGLVGFVLTAVSLTPDARYSLPALVFVAVFGTAWLRVIRRPVAVAGVVALVAVFAVNTILVDFGPRTRVRLTVSSKPLYYGNGRILTLFSGDGYAGSNQPYPQGRVLQVMQAAHAQGATLFAVDQGSANLFSSFTVDGLVAIGHEAGLGIAPGNDPAQLGPHDIYLIRLPPTRSLPKPCSPTGDGNGVYVEHRPGERPYCPPGTGGVPRG